MAEQADDRAVPRRGPTPTATPAEAPASSGTIDATGARSPTAHAMPKSRGKLGPIAVVRSPTDDPALAKTSSPVPAEEPRKPEGGAPLQDEPDPFVDRTLGGLYRIVSRIGVGGMGVVYLAEHVHIGKRFAIKVLSRSVAQHPQAVERLKQEAITASKIEHDNIVSIISFDRTDDGDVFIVMELLRGRDLARDLEHGRIPLERALRITYQVCRALGAAHDAGVVHRDLKPENIFLTEKNGHDFVKLLDFGISKVKRADMESVRMTKTGQLVGTPLYMSPEQARGETDVEPTADVYALGVILYEMCCGSPPFEAENYFQLLWKHGSETPETPRKRCPEAGIPEAVEAVILKALEKDPRDRYQSMDELEAALLAAAPDIDPNLPLRSPSYTSLAPDGGRASTPGAAARASLSTTEPQAIRSNRGVAVGAAVIGIGLVAAAIVLGVTREDRRTTGTTEAPVTKVRPADTRPDPPPPTKTVVADTPGVASPPNAPAVDEVSVTFESTPAGAEVLIDGVRLGETPLTAPLARGRAVQVVLRRRGFVDDIRSLIPAAGAQITSRLRPMRRTSGGSGGGGDVLPIKKSL
ncbi:MAG: serine/threonine protein kinase [Deltaproteobacteria bacterium]|nr:serine/threonine protein kinase [Deltaproteobacteria bacterium]